MKTKVIPVLSTVTLALTLTACSTDNADETPDTTAIVEETAPADVEEQEDNTPTPQEINDSSLTELAVNAVYRINR